MAGYTASEIEGAVSQFVKSTIKVERDPLGPVDISSAFNEVIQLFSSTLVFDPNAIFYLIYLASNRLNKDAEQLVPLIVDMYQAILEMGRYTTEVTKTTLLGDAAAALLDVDRTLLVNESISVGSFNRYVASLDGFIEVSLRPNIKDGTNIVRTPQQAQTEARTDLDIIVVGWGDILERTVKLLNMLTEFNDLDLEVIAIQDSVKKARIDLSAIQAVFEDTTTTKDQKISECRDSYLRLSAGKSVLINYTTVSDPTDPRMQSSSVLKGLPASTLGADQGISASLTSTQSAPWVIKTATNEELKVAEDGLSERTYTLSNVDDPSVVSGRDDMWGFNLDPSVSGFNIQASVSDRLEIDGLPVISLSTGTNQTAQDIVDDINTWAGAGSYPYSAAVYDPDTINFVKITKSAGTPRIEMTAINSGTRARVLGAYTELLFYEGQNDSQAAVTAFEAAKSINDAGYITATVARTVYADGETGESTSDTEFIVPEGSIPDGPGAGDMLLITEGENRGYHRIASITKVATFPDEIEVIATEPFADPAASNLGWVVISEKLVLTSKLKGSSILDSSLVVGSGNANSTLGFSGSSYGETPSFKARESGLDKDFVRADVVVGDLVYISAAEYAVLEVTDDGRQLELSPRISVDEVDIEFTILSAASVAYAQFLQSLSTWRDVLEQSDFSENLLELERVMNPLFVNKNPSIALLNQAKSTVESFGLLVAGLVVVLRGFVVRSVPRVDAGLKMLLERGLGRAYDTLLDADIAAFFGMDKDDAGNSSYLLKNMRIVVNNDLPLSKVEDDMGDIVHDSDVEIVDTDADYDYSDVDVDDSYIELGELPDSGVDFGDTKVRY